jgi:hypothetical protein
VKHHNKFELSNGELAALTVALEMAKMQYTSSSTDRESTSLRITIPELSLQSERSIVVPDKRSVRMQRHAPILPFADFVVNNLIGAHNKYARVLRDIGMLSSVSGLQLTND